MAELMLKIANPQMFQAYLNDGNIPEESVREVASHALGLPFYQTRSLFNWKRMPTKYRDKIEVVLVSFNHILSESYFGWVDSLEKERPLLKDEVLQLVVQLSARYKRMIADISVIIADLLDDVVFTNGSILKGPSLMPIYLRGVEGRSRSLMFRI